MFHVRDAACLVCPLKSVTFHNPPSLLVEPMKTSLFENRSGAIADKREAGPIDGKSLVAELFQKIEFRVPERSALIFAIGEMLVHAFHQSDCERVIGRPEAGNYRFCTG